MATHTTTMEKGQYGDGRRYNTIKIVPSASSTKQDWFWNGTSAAGNCIPSTSHLMDWKWSEQGYGARPGERKLADGIWVRKVSAQLTVAGDKVVIRDETSAGDILLQLDRGYDDYNIWGVASSDSTQHIKMTGNSDLTEITFKEPRLMKPYLHDSSPNNCTFGNGSSRGKCWVKIEVDDSRRQP